MLKRDWAWAAIVGWTLVVLLTLIIVSHTEPVAESSAPVVIKVGLQPCQTEDSTHCYWDASEQGNGLGSDFVSP